LFTVLGASGFIGSHLTQHLRNSGLECYLPDKWEKITDKNLGHVICCVGLTADFRLRPLEAIDAHVNYIVRILRWHSFDSLLYLSSTRVYSSYVIACEDDPIRVNPLNFEDVYNISKIMGESACFASGRKNVRVVRLSNVYGYDSKSMNFIFTLIRDAITNHKIILNSSLESQKDHVNVEDIARLLPEIALHGKQKLYNIASGENVSAGQITSEISRLTGCTIEISKHVTPIRFPRICVDRLQQEFTFTPSRILDDLPQLINTYKKYGGV
jgi:nucleoside-diphosphate-sugar epimerase